MDSYLNMLLGRCDRTTILGVVFYKIVNYKDNFYANHPTHIYLPYDQSSNKLPFDFHAVVQNGSKFNLYLRVNGDVIRVMVESDVSVEFIIDYVKKEVDRLKANLCLEQNALLSYTKALSLLQTKY